MVWPAGIAGIENEYIMQFLALATTLHWKVEALNALVFKNTRAFMM